MLTKINNMYQNRFISKASAKVQLFFDICKKIAPKDDFSWSRQRSAVRLLAIVLLVVLLTADAPEVRLHGLGAGSGVFLRKEGLLVGYDLREVDLTRPHHCRHGGETLADLQLLGGGLGGTLAMNGRVLQACGFHVVVNGAKFLRDLARDVVNRVFKYYFSHS